jgi:hypothetical protein
VVILIAMVAGAMVVDYGLNDEDAAAEARTSGISVSF